MSAEAAMIFKKSLMAGGSVRSLGCPPNDRRRPVGLAGSCDPARIEADEKDVDLGAAKFRVEALPPLPVAVVLRRSGDWSEEPRTRSHLELGR